ncbi:hypothetical protein RND81_10G249100 [Saponaria officinalis]|uniref:CP12 domain-containing protein n=1 Tax=Saponaria officinalis TaxID=3572 RepID=A0AAW1I656_SAPOF
MASMSLVMSPKVLLTSNPTFTNIETLPKSLFGNRVTYVKKGSYTHTCRMVAVRASPEKLSESIEQSIKSAQETCSENPESGECAAAWDEVEEVSAAASHARDKTKPNDPLEAYCKDNPETNECRTYDN